MRPSLAARPLPPRDAFLDMRVPRSHAARSRLLGMLTWLVALYTAISVLLINFGGVSFPLPTSTNARSRLGNTGLEILQWLNDGDDSSIPNFYHYRLYLNRICAVNPTRQRGNGLCYNPGILGVFRFSEYAPDAFVRSQKGYDAVVGKVDFFTPFVFWALAGVVCVALLFALPATFLADGAGGHTRWMVNQRSRGAMFALSAAVCHAAASGTLTYTVCRLLHWMQYVPQVSNIWIGKAPLAMTWAGTVLLVLCALALQDDVAVARRVWRANAQRRDVAVFDGLFLRPQDDDDPRDPDAASIYGRHWWLDQPLLRGGAELVMRIRRRRRRSSAARGKMLEDGDALLTRGLVDEMKMG